MKALTVRWLGTRDYQPVWQAMQRFTATRTLATPDEIWLLEHPPVYTMGVRGHARGGRLDRGQPPGVAPTTPIPVIETDRGGLITYHGPGQLIAYTLIDLARLGLSTRDLVSALENAVIDLLRQYGIRSFARPKAPGVYVAGAKIAFLGLRVKKFRSYHGLSLNVDLDLAPFRAIDPCGYRDLKVTRLTDLGIRAKVHEAAVPMLACLMAQLGFETVTDVIHSLPTDQETRHAHPNPCRAEFA